MGTYKLLKSSDWVGGKPADIIKYSIMVNEKFLCDPFCFFDYPFDTPDFFYSFTLKDFVVN